MYLKYHTDALVLESWPLGEADKLFSLYTRDFGLVHARASAIRRETSRMRYALQNFSRVKIVLVRGVRGWRIVGASEAEGFQNCPAHALVTFVRIARLMQRLVVEEKNEYLFAVFSEARRALMHAPRVECATIELVCVARILHSLGYLSSESLGVALFSHTAYEAEHLKEADKARAQLLVSVNRAIAETQL
jgi:DNA repair protein RecO